MPLGKNRKNEQARITKRRGDVFFLACQGYSQHEIAQQLGISQPTVSHDYNAKQAEWQEKATRDYEVRLCEELAKLNHLERLALEGYQKSLQDKKTVRNHEEEGVLVKVERITTTQSGEPDYLAVIHKCIDTRLKLMGAFKPTVVNQQININWSEMAIGSPSGPVIIDQSPDGSITPQE